MDFFKLAIDRRSNAVRRYVVSSRARILSFSLAICLTLCGVFAPQVQAQLPGSFPAFQNTSIEPSASDKPHEKLVEAVGRTAVTERATSTTAPVSSSVEIVVERLEGASSSPVVTALSASHEGRYLAIAGDDHVIRVYDLGLGKTVRKLVGHTDWIQSIVFSADSQELYSSGNDGRILHWQHQYPVEPEEIVQLPYAVRSLSLSTERSLLAVAGFSNEVKVWDLDGNDWKYQFNCECRDHTCVRFSPGGDKLLSGGRDGVLQVWRMEDGRRMLHKQLHQKRISTAAFSADGNKITSAGEDRHLIQYDLLTDEILLDREIATTKLRSLCLINDHLVAVAGSDNSIRLYDMVIDDVIAKLEGHFGSVAVMCPSNQYLVSGSFDTTVRLWDLEDEVRQQSTRSMPVGLAPLDVDARMRIR